MRRLLALTLSFATFAAAAPAKRPVIACFGDSLTAGYGLAPSQAWPALLQKRLDAEGYAYRVVNAGVSGDTTADGLRRLPSVLALKPAIVILELGANDGLRGLPISQMRKNLDIMTRKFQAQGAKVVLAGMKMPSNYGPDYTAAFEKAFSGLARRRKTALIPFFLQGVALKPELDLGDGLHPNAAGEKIVLATVWRTLKPLLDKQAS